MKGSKKSVIGTAIPDDAADEFLLLAGSGSQRTKRGIRQEQPTNWCGRADPVDIFLYVLALENDRFYAGLTSNLGRRIRQHFSGAGAEWTKRHRPLRVMHSINTGTQNGQQAEAMEDEVVVALMVEYGIDNVRGGHFSQTETIDVEPALRAYGVWDRVKQAQFRTVALDLESSWSDALDGFLDMALRYYDAGAPAELRDEVFAAAYRLTRYRYWREAFAPTLDWAFWNPKGVLPVLLSFKLRRPVSSRLSCSYEVLAAALSRSRHGAHRLRRLFLLAWQAYQPPTTDNQAATVVRFMEYLDEATEWDRQYDDFVSVLFAETRSLLRA